MGDLPDSLTGEEAARSLRIGRTAAYEQTRRFEDTNGEEGIPVIRVGRLMRVPRTALESWQGGPLSNPYSEPEPHKKKPPQRRPRRAKPRLQQDTLPFDG